MILWQLAFTVAVWWIANTLTSVVSKNVMYEESETYEGVTGWTTAFKDLRWLDLTVLQHLIGMVASAAWLKVVMKQPLLPEEMPRPAIYMAAVGNVIGNLATNAAYALISSSTTQVIKACEPIFTFGFSILLLSNRESLTLLTLLSIITMIVGACMFVVMDASFNVWGLIAAICSNIAFPVRNIYLKKLSNLWTNSLQKYAIISTYSVLMLLPAVVIKLTATQQLLHVKRIENMISSLSHSAYNIASIGVLQNISPLTHAILNLSKRVFVIFVNIAYFHTPLSVTMSIGLLVFFAGLFGYFKIVAGGTNSKVALSKKSLALIFVMVLTCFCGLYLQHHVVNDNHSIHDKHQNFTLPDKRIVSAWVFERPVPLKIIDNIKSLSQKYPNIPVHVYCGTLQCMDVITELDRSRITSEFLVISDIVKGTPLEQWIARHPLNKILSGTEFEKHLQIAAQLGILWHYGGIYVDSTVKIMEDLPETSSIAWIVRGVDGRESLDLSCFPKEHPFIDKLAKSFISEYSKEALKLKFSKILTDTYTSCVKNGDCPKCIGSSFERLNSDYPRLEKHHYGTLSYDTRVQTIGSANLGDEIQGIPGLQFVPYVDHFVERDALSKSSEYGTENVTVFFNAWWGDRNPDWPPPSNIRPIMISVHTHNTVQKTWAAHIDYLKSRSPIGCRDYSCVDFLTSHGVEAYFSGCITLLTKNPSIEKGNTNTIYLVDVKEEFIRMLPSHIQKTAIRIHHKMEGKGTKVSLERFSAAYRLIEKYASAKLVITQRIHCALPCVGMGTPVIFINSPKLPGGGGSKKESSDRTGGLLALFHTLDMYSLSNSKARDWLKQFPWDSPPPNPNVDLMMRLRATAWNVIRQDRALYDTARKFGLIPMAPPPAMPEEADQLLFHLILPTSSKAMKWFNHSCGTCNLEEVVSWRSIESIFHHHPFAKVIVHSNTVLQSDFAVLTEAGYTIKVQSYDLVSLLEDSPAQSFSEIKNDHQLDLLRLGILYKFGGIYMDNDIILINPVDSLDVNTVAWQDLDSMTISKSFMNFRKGSNVLKAYLETFDDTSTSDTFTKTLAKEFDDDQLLNSHAFYSLHNKDLSEYCLTASDQSFMDNYKENTYGVQLNTNIEGMTITKLEEGTLCKQLLNSFCVLCNKQY